MSGTHERFSKYEFVIILFLTVKSERFPWIYVYSLNEG